MYMHIYIYLFIYLYTQICLSPRSIEFPRNSDPEILSLRILSTCAYVMTRCRDALPRLEIWGSPGGHRVMTE